MNEPETDAMLAWERVRAQMPNLARELSRELFVAEVGERLRESQAYRDAMSAGDRARVAEAVWSAVAAVLGRLLP